MNFSGWCPIVSATYDGGESKSKCKKEDCAWWDGDNNSCIVWSIKDKLNDLG